MTATIRLGLIGGNIRASRSPALHRIAGRLSGLSVSYELLIPAEIGLDFDAVLARCAEAGFRGVNITYPYKEAIIAHVRVPDPAVARLGAVNTVVFGPEGPEAANTDYTGFAAAFRARWPGRRPGAVALIGAGGVGRAIGFALALLGAEELRIADRDRAKAAALAAALAGLGPAAPRLSLAASAEAAAEGAEGVVNATPIGMVGQAGSPLPAAAWAGRDWAFDAVYTPADTRFLAEAAAAGVDCLSGWELFFHQGVDAFRIFTGRPVADLAALRAALLAGEDG